MSTNVHCRARGVTLLELLVVLMILSIVLTAAVRTWDVTLERGRAQTTVSKLNQLVTVIVGDPDYIVAGQRADFGFVGDEGRVPDSLAELVVRPPGDSVWRGPYVRSTFNQSSSGFQTDGWGQTIVYGRQAYGSYDSLFVRSYGGRGVADPSRWQTVHSPYTYDALTNNTVDGLVVDVRGKSPAEVSDTFRRSAIISNLKVTLYWPKDGKLDSLDQPGAAAPKFTFPGIPQGTHRIVATYVNFNHLMRGTFTATQDVPVYPGLGAHNITLRLPVDWDDDKRIP